LYYTKTIINPLFIFDKRCFFFGIISKLDPCLKAGDFLNRLKVGTGKDLCGDAWQGLDRRGNAKKGKV